MDAGARLKRPWEDEEHSLHSSGRMPGPIVMPSITSTTTYPLASPIANSPNDRRLPSLTTALERQLRSPIDQQHSTFPKYNRLSQLPPRGYSPPEGSLKRARLLYNPNHRSESLNNARSSPTNVSEHDGSASRESETYQVPPSQEELGSNKWFQNCSNCSELKDLVQNVISGLVVLDAEVRHRVSGSTIFGQSTKQGNDPSLTPTDVGEAGLRRSLMWAANSIESNIQLVRDLAITRPLPLMASTTPGSAHPDHSSINTAPNESLKRRLDLSEKERYEDGKKFCPPSSFEDHLPRGFETITTSNMSSEGQRRGYGNEQQPQPPIPAHSPHRTVSSSGSVFGPPQSPMQVAPSSRMLPSPSSLHFPSSASGFASMPSPPSASQSAQAAHLQDLQHQISTKTLALQTLQREHDNLLAAFSRQQTRCATLDKKSQVSDNEINSLTEEKIRLQTQVEALDLQVEDLVKSRDEAHKQSVANGAQYMQIMSHSSRLQAQGAADLKRWKTEKEEWEKQREELQSRIEELEANSPTWTSSGPIASSGRTEAWEGRSTGTTERTPKAAGPDPILSSTSLEVLRAEVIRLRDTCREMELTLQDLKSEATRIEQVMRDFGTIGKRISTKAEHGIQQFGSRPAREDADADTVEDAGN